MITIQRTVNIPPDKRLVLELPHTVPSGHVNVCLVVERAEIVTPPAQKKNDSSRIYAGCLKGKNIFKGDPVAIQRKMRDEWYDAHS